MAVLPVSLGFAQTATFDSTATTEPAVVLSPFEVRTERDTGFVAASSVSGGRLAGDLKDTPVAYTVLTSDFIDALQLVDLAEMTKWAPNTSETPQNGEEYINGNLTVSSRGVGSNNPQRNFFPVFFNFDSYNVERLDLARGPNAVLFGTSGVGGTANSVTKRAQTNRRSTNLRVSYGSWNNYRTTLDHNQPIGDKFALRLNVLFQDRDGWRTTEMQRKQGITLAGLWKVTPTTEIRAEAEYGKLEQSVVTTNFDDNVSGWTGVTFAARTSNSAPNGIGTYGANTAVFTPSSGERLVNYQGWAFTQGGNQAAAVPAGGTIVVGPLANITNQSVTQQLNLPSNLYDIALANSNFFIPERNYSTFSDEPIFGVEHKDFTVMLTQQIGENFFAEIAGNYGTEDTSSNIGISRGMSRILIDVNSVLPDGRPNLNFREPYAQVLSYPYFQYREKKNFRASLGYLLNNTRIGDFSFNMIAGITDQTYDRNAFRYMLKRHDDPRRWPTDSPIMYRYYLTTDEGRPMPEPASWTYVNPINNTTTEVPAGRVRDYTNDSFNQINDARYEYIQAAGSGRLLKGRLSLIAAARQDRFKTHQESPVRQFDNPLDWDGYTRNLKPAAPADWSSLTYRLRDASGTPIGVPIPAESRPRLSSGERDPLYASDRFQDDYSPPDQSDSVNTMSVGGVFHVTKKVSVFTNYAESFAPPASTLKIDGSLFPPRTSKGVDMGLRITLLNGNLVANIIRYEGKETNGTITSTTFPFNNIIQANALNDLTPGGINQRGLALLPLGYVDSVDTETEGWEFELIANFSRQWRLMFNAGLPKAFQTGGNKESLAYYEANEATLRQIVIDAGGSFNGNVASFTATIPPGQSTTEGPNAVAAWNTIQNTLASISREPMPRTRVPEWTANIFTEYAFSGRLKGLKVGAGVNYRGRQIIGNRGADTIRNPANPAQAIDDPSVDAKTPVYADDYIVGTLTMSYSRRIAEKYTLEVALKIDNLFDYDKPLYYNTVMRPPGGDLTNPARVATPARYAWVTPQNFTLTTTLRF